VKTLYKVAATISITDAGSMSKRGRRKIAAWLKSQAEDLENFGEEYSKAF
jgi:hypothetical protein